MLARITLAMCAAALTVATHLACAPVPPGSLGAPRRSSAISPLTPTSRFVDAAQIARSGSQSALEAVRMLVPAHRLAEIDVGLPIASRRAGGLASRGRGRIVVDGHPIFDLESLRAIPAREIVAIHILNMSDAAMVLGPGYEGGAIVVSTQAALRTF